jgi:hypothetical protein
MIRQRDSGRIEEPIREIAGMTRSVELQHELGQILRLPRWKYTEIDPAHRRPRASQREK